MSTCLSNIANLDDGLYKNPFFKLYESHLVIKCNEEMKIFHLDKISNVRFSKKRNFTVNIVLFLITLLIYSSVSDYLGDFFLYRVLLFVMVLVTSVISLWIKNYDYSLYINLNHFGFRKLKISKKQSLYVEDFVSIYKTKYFEKNNQNDLDFINFKHSS